MKIEIKNKEDLIKAVRYMHDSGFNSEDIKYNSSEKNFTVVSKEYEFKGTFIQSKADRVKAICNLALQNVKICEIKFASKTDENGYNAIGEDYFNTVKIKDNKITFITTFQRIHLEVDNFTGTFETTNLEIRN